MTVESWSASACRSTPNCPRSETPLAETPEASPRILIVGVGNVLHGDDGFGVELARRLMQRSDLTDRVRVLETGIGGMGLVQEVMNGCEALLLLDSYGKGETPGTLYLVEPQLPDLDDLDVQDRRAYFSDTHYATPIRALSLLQQMQRLPAIVNVLGCEPQELDELHVGLSPAVAAALDDAESMVRRWISAPGCA